MELENIITDSRPEDESYWQKHVAAYNKGDASKINYCRKNNVHYHRFLYWHNKLSKSNDDAALIPVNIRSDLPVVAKCTLELSQGCRILIHDEALALKLLTSVAK